MKLKTLINQYINYRKSFGEKFDTNARRLKQFCKLVGNNIVISKITTREILAFLYGKKQLTSNFFANYSTLKGFYDYCINRGYVRHCPLPTALPQRPPSFVPYIYSHDELKRFFTATLTYPKISRDEISPYTMHMFFILLYCTGLRVSEAISLTMGNIDLSQAILTIKHTKFYKTRLVPFNQDLLNLLTEYIQHRKNRGYPQETNAPFFTSKKHNFFPYTTVIGIFNRVCKKAGIIRTRHRARIHDFRHTFAAHRIVSWYQKNADVQNLLPILSVYMGHTKLSSTSVYLTMTPELLRAANKRFEQYTKEGSL